MHRRYRTSLAISLISSATLAGMTTMASAAPDTTTAAASKPVINFGFVANQLEVGQRVQVRYNSKKVPKGGSVVLQRAIGTAGVWHTIAHLKNSTTTKTVTEPAVGQGITTYRLVITDHHGKALASKAAKVTVYAPVALATILGQSTNTLEVGTTLFRYATSDGQDFSTQSELFKITGSTCRSLNLTFTPTMYSLWSNGSATDTATLTITSEGADASSATTQVGSISNVSGPTSGDIEVDWSSTSEGDSIFVNGTGDCYTGNGQVAQQ